MFVLNVLINCFYHKRKQRKYIQITDLSNFSNTYSSFSYQKTFRKTNERNYFGTKSIFGFYGTSSVHMELPPLFVVFLLWEALFHIEKLMSNWILSYRSIFMGSIIARQVCGFNF